MVKDKRMIGIATVDGVDTGQIDSLTGQRVNAEGKPLTHEHRFVPWGSDPRFERCSCGAVRRADAVNAATGELNLNPCVQRWGRGPEGALCKTCVHLVRQAQAAIWYKCAQRDDLTHGAKTDQRVGWDACARYEARDPEPVKRRKTTPSVPMDEAVRQALAAMPVTPAPKREQPRFTVGQTVKVIANQGGLYAAQVGVTGTIAKVRQQRRYGYRSYDVRCHNAKGAEKIVIVREDDLEAVAETVPAPEATSAPKQPAGDEPRFTIGQKVMLDHRSDAIYARVARKGAEGEIVAIGRLHWGIRRYDVRYSTGATERIREEHLLPVIGHMPDGQAIGLCAVEPIHSRLVYVKPDIDTPKLTPAQQRALAEWKRRCPNTAYQPNWIDAVFPQRSNAEAALRRSIQALVKVGVFRELPDHRVQLVEESEA